MKIKLLTCHLCERRLGVEECRIFFKNSRVLEFNQFTEAANYIFTSLTGRILTICKHQLTVFTIENFVALMINRILRHKIMPEPIQVVISGLSEKPEHLYCSQCTNDLLQSRHITTYGFLEFVELCDMTKTVLDLFENKYYTDTKQRNHDDISSSLVLRFRHNIR